MVYAAAALGIWVYFCAFMALDTVLPTSEPRMKVLHRLGFLWWFRLYLTFGLVQCVHDCPMCDGGWHDREALVLCGYCDGTGVEMPHRWFAGQRPTVWHEGGAS